jgi:cytochrome P450
MPGREQAAAQPRLQDRVQPPKYRSHDTSSDEHPPGRASARHSPYEFLNALKPGGFSFTVVLADKEATRWLMVDIAAALSNRAGKLRRNQLLPDNTCVVRDRQRPTG